MSTYKIESADGSLVLLDPCNPDRFDWLEVEVVTFPSESVVCVRATLCDSVDSNLVAWDVEGADDIREDMTEWLEDNGFSVSIPCDFGDKASFAAASAEAVGLYNRFRGGDHTPLDARYRVWWTSEDKQGSMDCGDFLTIDEAKASLPGMTAELLRVDGGNNPDGILAGTFGIECCRDNSGCGVEQRFDVADFAPLRAAA